jgi:hypothetical protein
MSYASLCLDAARIRVALGAARAVAAADGEITTYERDFIGAAARALGYRGDPESVPFVSPEEVRQAIAEPELRERLVQALVLVALIDGKVVDAELRAVCAYANALGVDEPRIRNLKQLCRGRSRWIYVDLWLRSRMLRAMLGKARRKNGLLGVLGFFAGIAGVNVEPDLAWRYKQLGMLPEGTFGRAFWTHLTERKYAFPGEMKGLPQEAIKHDLAHVLGGYGTDPSGECEVVGFISGFMKTDPFAYFFQIFVHMQLGVHVFDGTPIQHLSVPAERILAALERGRRVNTDLYDPDWDYWADMPLPLEDVRRKYGIAPKKWDDLDTILAADAAAIP